MRKVIAILALCLSSALACTPSSKPTAKTTELTLNGIVLKSYPEAQIVISQQEHSVAITLPFGSEPGTTEIRLAIPSDATSIPDSGEEVDLNALKAIYLTASSGNSVKYSVSVSVKGSASTNFYWMTADDYLVRSNPDEDGNMDFRFPYGADVSNLTFTVQTDEELTYEPDITSGVSLETPLKVKITAADGETSREVTLSASFYPKDKGVRGLYLPSPSHSSSFISYSNICQSLDLMQELNFNCLYVCTWAASQTAYESEVLLSNSTYSNAAQGNMYSMYSGGSGDALADIISEAHKRNIKVIFWYEYGFMHAAGGVNTDDPVLARHPDWIGRNASGGYSAYNNNDFYLNGYSSEVQDFVLNLMKEALQRYPEVDGIQGDDRLPAMPRNSGYNDETKALYLAQTGNTAPTDYQNTDWVNWRLGVLNAFAVRMYKELKSIKPTLLVCFAPNKYPWCERNLMQDWPQWIADGVVDLLTVQCYVTSAYETDVRTALSYVKRNTSKEIFNPAMILKNGGAILSPTLLAQELQYNRQIGTLGESQFWFDGLYDPGARHIFELYYSYPVEFPL